MGDYDQHNGREEKPLDYDVVDKVKNFVFDLHDAMRRSLMLEELEVLYSSTFRTVSDENYKTEPWPAAEVIARQCGNDEVFLHFYREMRLRHMTQTMSGGGASSLQIAAEAWGNYCSLFDVVLQCEDTEFIITPAWAFDIINEFVYQVSADLCTDPRFKARLC